MLTVLNEESEVQNTVLHEIAHALTPEHGHDGMWQAACMLVGAKPVRCYNRDSVLAPFRYKATCGCGKELRKLRKPRRTLKHVACGSILTWEKVEVVKEEKEESN